MAEDEAKKAADAERKAKAARAKKMLAQRQKAKANAVSSSSVTPSSPSSTVGDTPTLPSARTSLSLDDGVRDGLDEKTTNTSAAFVLSEGREANGSEAPDASEGASRGGPLSSSVQTTDPTANLHQTVSLLIAERSDLQTQIVSLQSSLASAKADSQLLSEGRVLISRLEGEKRDLANRVEELDERVKRAEEGTSELANVRREAVDLRRERDELVSARDAVEGRRRGIEETERERGRELERAREREGGLEAEVGRLRQGNNELSTSLSRMTSELESLRSSSSVSATTLTDLQTSHSTLQSTHDSLQTTHTALQSEFASLRSAHDSLKASSEASTSSHSSLSTALESTRSELAMSRSNLEKTTKRADVAEKKRAALQKENDELVRQLEEVRGRVVEVMEEKVELAASLESWEGKGRGWERTRVELEAKAEEAVALHDQLASIAEGNRALSEKAEAHDLLAREHAALRSQLDQLRSTPSASNIPLPTSPPPSDVTAGSPSDSRSSHQSRIRTLESSLHASTSRVHSLSRQLTDMHAAYATAQKERDDALAAASFSGSTTRGLFSPAAEERESPGIGLGRPPILPTRSVDMILPASVRHKRQVSLTALKARMEPARTVRSSRLGSTTEEDEGEVKVSPASDRTRVRKQFGDEIVFCCPACEGDLITL